MITEHGLHSEEVMTKLIIDSGVPCHMCNNAGKFLTISNLKRAQKVTLGDIIQVIAKATIDLHMEGSNGKQRKVQLSDMLFVVITCRVCRSMLLDSKIPKRFWAEALPIATYIHGPTNDLQRMISYEA